MSIRVRTRDWEERDRVERWREEFGRHVIRADVVAIAPRPERFDVSLDLHPGETLTMTEMRLRAVRKVRDQTWFGDGAESLTLMMCRAGTVRYDTADTRHALRPGETVLFSHGVPVALEWDDASIVTLQLDRHALDEPPGKLVGQPLSAADPHARLLRSYADAICTSGIALTPMLEGHLLDLARVSLAGAPAAPSPAQGDALSAARLSAARRLLKRDARNPALRLEDVAQALAVSARTLQRDFARAGSSFGSELLELRLATARAALLRHARTKVLDVALEAGFNDLSHFNRSFRDRYGHSPTETRASRIPVIEKLIGSDRL